MSNIKKIYGFNLRERYGWKKMITKFNETFYLCRTVTIQ